MRSAVLQASWMSLDATTLTGSVIPGRYFELTWSLFMISVSFLPSTCIPIKQKVKKRISCSTYLKVRTHSYLLLINPHCDGRVIPLTSFNLIQIHYVQRNAPCSGAAPISRTHYRDFRSGHDECQVENHYR